MGLDIFIEGETIDLAIPTRDYAFNSEWFSYFNNKSITRYLDQGSFPNTRDKQVEFWLNNQEDRLLLIVQSKEGEGLGVISLSCIDYKKRFAVLSIVMDQLKNIRMSPIFALEAVCNITQHGFESLGLIRIEAGQHTDLFRWQNRMELSGYRLEGIHKDKFVKGNEVSTEITIATTYSDYIKITSRRNGRIWDSQELMEKRLINLPENTYRKMLMDLWNKAADEYYERIYNL